MTLLQSGSVQSIDRALDDWAFLDIGFSGQQRSSGLIIPGEDGASDLTWADACTRLVGLVEQRHQPLNLMVEAPLSMAFDRDGNPVGRAFEIKNGKSRYWYMQGGAVVLLATSILLHRLDREAKCEVRLFEAFLSFKSNRSGHSEDAKLMRTAIFAPESIAGRLKIFEGDQIKREPTHRLVSSTFDAGLAFGAPVVFDFLSANSEA